MRLYMQLTVLLAFSIAIVGCASEEKVVDDRPKPPQTAEQQRYVEGEIIVRYEDNFSEQSIHSMLKVHGAKIKQKLPGENQYLIQLPFGYLVRSAVPLYNGLIGVKWAEPNYIYRMMQQPPIERKPPVKRIKIRKVNGE